MRLGRRLHMLGRRWAGPGSAAECRDFCPGAAATGPRFLRHTWPARDATSAPRKKRPSQKAPFATSAPRNKHPSQQAPLAVRAFRAGERDSDKNSLERVKPFARPRSRPRGYPNAGGGVVPCGRRVSPDCIYAVPTREPSVPSAALGRRRRARPRRVARPPRPLWRGGERRRTRRTPTVWWPKPERGPIYAARARRTYRHPRHPI